jgi:tetratricopeptide (TPR) repeat protein
MFNSSEGQQRTYEDAGEMGTSMNAPAPDKSPFAHDLFISYSRKDLQFAHLLERGLGNYSPPKGLGVPARRLRVFRDQSDLTGVEYHQSIARHLRDSRKLILLCSAHARASSFVNEEVRQFAAARGAENIIPLLIGGLPNNEASRDQEALKAFPDALCEALQMPLAGDYRNFDARRDKLDKGTFHGAWYTLLANLLELSRSEIERRDQKRTARRRAITIGTVSGVIALLSIAFLVTLFAQREAVRQRDQAEHRRIVALAKLVASRATEQAERGTTMWGKLLARQAFLFNERVNGEALAQVDSALRVNSKTPSMTTVEKRADEVLHVTAVNRQGTLLASGTDDVIKLWSLGQADGSPRLLKGHTVNVVALAFSPDGTTLASGSWDETVRVWNLSQGEPTSRVLRGHIRYVLAVAFSPDGKFLASGGDDATVRIWNLADTTAEPQLMRAPNGSILSLAFSPDGKTVAAGTSAGRVLLWDRTTRADVAPRMFVGPENRVTSLAFTRDGHELAAAIDRTVAIWQLRRQVMEPRTVVHTERASGVAFSRDGSMLAIGTVTPDVQLRQLANLDAPPIVLARAATTDSIAYSDDGSRLVATGSARESGDRRASLQTWRVPTGLLADEICKDVVSNLPALAWERFVGADIPYELTCTRHSVHPDYYLMVEEFAKAGDIDRASALYRRADELDHPGDKPRDRRAELNRLAAEGLIYRGTATAGNGDVDGGLALLRKAIALDPSRKLDAEAVARKASAGHFLREGERRALEGDFEAALPLYTKAKELDATLDFDPRQRAAQYAADGLIGRAILLSYRGDIKQALATLKRALELDPERAMTSEQWNQFCWNGSVWGHATEVMFACERAVEMDEGSDRFGSVDSRGLARALVGNLQGALADFRHFLDVSSFADGVGDIIAQRKSWIAGLERGENPVTPEVLAELQRQL